MPPTFFFVLDVTAGAVSSGMLAVACETIKGALDSLPGDERTLVGVLTFDAHLHFYRLSALPDDANVVPRLQRLHTHTMTPPLSHAAELGDTHRADRHAGHVVI